MRATVPEATNARQDDQLCEGLKAIILLDLHVVQTIWGTNLFTEDWGFLLVDSNNTFS